ncbi:MAG: hypothetical protein LBI86_01020 [Treponema sp.]|nr:hypothetical protein [Treponema sp.]
MNNTGAFSSGMERTAEIPGAVLNPGLRSERIIENGNSHISDRWGVRWNEMETVRDFLQNFYDANPIKDIVTAYRDTTAYVYAPAEFDYRELVILGSDKDEDSESVGQYGEGFKASLLNAMRNWGCTVECYIGSRKIRFYFKSMTIGRSEKRLVHYELSEIDPIRGSCLVVSNCTAKLLKEFRFGLNYFYYNTNPLLGDLLVGTYNSEITVHKSNDPEKNGHVFYRNMLRAKIDLPIVIVCRKQFKKIDEKIAHDRDRKAFTGDVLDSLITLIFRGFRNYELAPMLVAVQDWWIKGDPVLAEIAESRKYSEKNYDSSMFPENYYAGESYPRDDYLLIIQIKEIVEEFKSRNYFRCPRYMSYFGMKTPDGEAMRRWREKQNKINRIYSRKPTPDEQSGINLLARFIKDLSPEMFTRFEHAGYTVGESDEILGELRKNRQWNEQHVFLNKDVFTGPFEEALSVLIHEWMHIFGYDGSRFFSDALTNVIALILKNGELLEQLKAYKAEWAALAGNIGRERKNMEKRSGLWAIVEGLSVTDMRTLLCGIPEDNLFRLLDEKGLL